jgi:hypothetical protein
MEKPLRVLVGRRGRILAVDDEPEKQLLMRPAWPHRVDGRVEAVGERHRADGGFWCPAFQVLSPVCLSAPWACGPSAP